MQAINSPSLDYSHFISLPLAMHPELVDKLIKFQNSILGDVEGITNVPLVSYVPKSFKPPAQYGMITESVLLQPCNDLEVKDTMVSITRRFTLTFRFIQTLVM